VFSLNELTYSDPDAGNQPLDLIAECIILGQCPFALNGWDNSTQRI
jgi:hypothetical protein